MKRNKILLVDDELDFVAALSERLKIRGYQTSVVTDGESAISAIEEQNFDIVVLDILMPGLSGLDVLKRVKQQKPDIEVIMLSGHGSTKDGIEGMQLGAFDYLIKPVDISELTQKLEIIANR